MSACTRLRVVRAGPRQVRKPEYGVAGHRLVAARLSWTVIRSSAQDAPRLRSEQIDEFSHPFDC
jgi:hypothetical protein